MQLFWFGLADVSPGMDATYSETRDVLYILVRHPVRHLCAELFVRILFQ
jgi:hypothetical protein